MNRRLRTAFYAILYFFGLMTGTTIVHEAGHATVAKVLGVPIKEIKLGFDGINPSATMQLAPTNVDLTIQHYAGGFLAAFVLLIAYIFIFRRYQYKPSIITWILGLITLPFLGNQLGQGYIEGKFHVFYIASASSAFDQSSIFMVLCMILPMLFHLIICPVSKLKGMQAKGVTVEQ